MRIDSKRARSAGALSLLAMIAFAPFALAQQGKPKKPKKPKAAPAASATATETAPPPPPEPAPAPPPEPAPPPPPAPAPTESAAASASLEVKSADDVAEKPGESYRFVGLRYRATVIPKFLLNLFVDEGATIVSHSIGVEYEMRHDGFSLIPWLTFNTYGTGDILFHEKGKDLTEQNYSLVNSSLKAIYVGGDVLWSAAISPNVQFEYGAGAGLGFFFGDLETNWVTANPSGDLVSSSGVHYAPCATVVPNTGCDPKLHSNSPVNKVGGYVEPSWFGGGSRPVIFPHIALPELGVRVKPTKDIAARATLGFSLTGFFFGISGSYGLH
jgi:hypothetical protein